MERGPDMEDRDLACQAQAGCVDAFEALVLRYEARVYSYLFSRCGDRADAQELTQDTFVRAWQGLGSWKASRPFKTWLFGIAHNRCVDNHRAHKVRKEPEGDPGADHNTPLELLARREDARFLWGIAARVLPEAQYECLWLRYAEEMDIAEVASVVRKTRAHVKVLLFRARMALARHPAFPRQHGISSTNLQPAIAINETV